MRHLLICFAICCTCAAQSITIGGIGGGRITDDVVAFHTPASNVVSGVPPFRLESRFYLVGPMIEIGLPHSLGVEFDALYHRQGFFYTFYSSAFTFGTFGERDNVWEFPVLLKYKPRWHAMNPFIESGVAPRTITGRITEIIQNDFLNLGPPSSSTYSASYGPTVGFVSGGGIEFILAACTSRRKYATHAGSPRLSRERTPAELVGLFRRILTRWMFSLKLPGDYDRKATDKTDASRNF